MVDLSYLKQNVFAGESGGDYNALYGYANRRGPFQGVRLTDMTVNQALQFANPSGPYAAHVRGQIGRTATPMGAYQVVGSTLRDAVKGLGLTGNEPFDQATQDRIAQWIYENQGPSAWEGWGKGGGNVTVSTSGGQGMGLLDFQDEQPQPFGQRLKESWRSGDLMDRLAVAFNAARLNPDPTIAQLAGGRMQQRSEQKAQEKAANRTAAWLTSIGRGDLAQAMLSGGLDPKQAASMAMAPPEAINGVEVGGKLVNPRTGEVIYDPTGGTTPTLTSDQLTSLNTLRDDATKATAELNAMRDAWTNVNTFYQNAGAVSDRALVIAFAKILDPTSVVRESESAAIANSGSIDAGLKAMLLNALQGGGSLPDDIRNEIVALSREMYANKMPAVQSRLGMLVETAKRAGLPADLVFADQLTPPPAPALTTPPPTPQVAPPPAPRAPQLQGPPRPPLSDNALQYILP